MYNSHLGKLPIAHGEVSVMILKDICKTYDVKIFNKRPHHFINQFLKCIVGQTLVIYKFHNKICMNLVLEDSRRVDFSPDK